MLIKYSANFLFSVKSFVSISKSSSFSFSFSLILLLLSVFKLLSLFCSISFSLFSKLLIFKFSSGFCSIFFSLLISSSISGCLFSDSSFISFKFDSKSIWLLASSSIFDGLISYGWFKLFSFELICTLSSLFSVSIIFSLSFIIFSLFSSFSFSFTILSLSKLFSSCFNIFWLSSLLFSSNFSSFNFSFSSTFFSW